MAVCKTLNPGWIMWHSRPRLCKAALACEILAFKQTKKLPGTKVPGSEVGVLALPGTLAA
jgi:hypothetical protein